VNQFNVSASAPDKDDELNSSEGAIPETLERFRDAIKISSAHTLAVVFAVVVLSVLISC
jgi:hypothetical protein